MHATVSILFKAITIVAILLIVRFGYLAATESDGPRKGNATFVASLAFSLWICISCLLFFTYEHTRPIFEMQGLIDSVSVHNSSSRHYSADIRIQTNSGGYITIHASDRSQGFRPGQVVRVKYRGDTGELIKMYFYDLTGKQVGLANSTLDWTFSWAMIIGLICVWATIRKWRRDPEGAEA